MDGYGIRGFHKSTMAACAQRAETEIVVAILRAVPVAIGTPHVPGGVIPAAAAVHPIGALLYPLPMK